LKLDTENMPFFSHLSNRVSDMLWHKPHSTYFSDDSQSSSSPILHGSDHYDDKPNNYARLLLSTEKLEIPPKHSEMFQNVNMAVIEYMSDHAIDAAHDYEHIERVVVLAHKIYEGHKNDRWVRDTDKTVVYLACMVHEVGVVRENGEYRDQEDIVRYFLKANSCKDPRIYSGAAYVAARISFTGELLDPEQIKADADNYPALRMVQDAVRLDGLGAVGIGRGFVSKVIEEERNHGPCHSGTELNYDKFHKYLELMKTGKGRSLAKERLVFMEKFRGHWFEETDVSSVL
jgi:uncharacterized protein